MACPKARSITHIKSKWQTAGKEGGSAPYNCPGMPVTILVSITFWKPTDKDTIGIRIPYALLLLLLLCMVKVNTFHCPKPKHIYNRN